MSRRSSLASYVPPCPSRRLPNRYFDSPRRVSRARPLFYDNNNNNVFRPSHVRYTQNDYFRFRRHNKRIRMIILILHGIYYYRIFLKRTSYRSIEDDAAKKGEIVSRSVVKKRIFCECNKILFFKF